VAYGAAGMVIDRLVVGLGLPGLAMVPDSKHPRGARPAQAVQPPDPMASRLPLGKSVT
jgi:hypothetical protein